MPVTIASDTSSINVMSKGGVGGWHTIRRLASRTSRPDVLEGSLYRPHDDTFRLAILAWSFSEWSSYSGYAYAATAGAHYVRRVLLDGTAHIPESAVVFFDDPLKEGVKNPRPVFVVRAESELQSLADVDEFLGIGVSWGGRFVGILPPASDADGEIYDRIKALIESGASLRYVRVAPFLEAAGLKRLDQVLTVTDARLGRTLEVTSVMSSEDIDALVEDHHRFRLDPINLPRRYFPSGRAEHFYMIEDAGERSPLPKVRGRKTRRTTIDRMGRLDELTAVRRSQRDLWHIASHVRLIEGRPRDAVVFCGRDVALSDIHARPINGVGLDGSMPMCGACTEVMGMRSARERRNDAVNNQPRREGIGRLSAPTDSV